MYSPTPDLIPFPTTYRTKILTQQQVNEIKEGTLHLLENIGIAFPSEQALSIFSDHGADVDFKNQIVRIPASLVENAMASAPRSFILGGREERFDLCLDGSNSYLSTDGCGVHVVDLETRQLRPSCKEDVAALARVSDALPMISFFWPLVSAQDYGRTAPLHECHAGLTNTLKHVRGGTTVVPQLARYIVEMATIVCGGVEERRKRPPLCANICTIAPLAHDKHGIESALVYAEAGIPVSFMAMPTLGSTAPATPLGALVTGDAEVVSAMILMQLAFPGTPVFHSIISSLMNPRTGGYIGKFQMPMSWLAVQLAHDAWQVPSLGGGSVSTDAEATGWLSGSESGLGSVRVPIEGGEICGYLGLLDASMVFSPEKIILDHEIYENLYDVFYGFLFDEEGMALDVIADVGPGSHFLRQKHTRQHIRDYRYSPLLYQSGVDNKKRAPEDVAFEEYKRILETHKPKPLPGPVLKELDTIMTIADREAANLK
jgi:trimethylamine--corrinoid protein Co-methyltransferase